MKEQRLIDERIKPAITELYSASEHPFWKRAFDYEALAACAPGEEGEGKKRRFPTDLFYIPIEAYDAVAKKACRGLRKQHIFPYKIDYVYSDDDIEDMKRRVAEAAGSGDGFVVSDLERKIACNDENRRHRELFDEYVAEARAADDALDSGAIDRKGYNAAMRKIWEKYGCHETSYDGNKVRFSLFNYGPTSHKPSFDEYAAMFARLDKESIMDDEAVEAVVRDSGASDRAVRTFRDAVQFWRNYVEYSGRPAAAEDADGEGVRPCR